MDILAIQLLLLMAGCGQDAEGSSGMTNDAVSVDVPSIYVAQTPVMKEAGEPAVERNYRQRLKACHDA